VDYGTAINAPIITSRHQTSRASLRSYRIRENIQKGLILLAGNNTSIARGIRAEKDLFAEDLVEMATDPHHKK